MSKVHSTKCCFQVLGTVAVICSSPIDHDVPRTPAVNLQVQQEKFMDNTLNKSEQGLFYAGGSVKLSLALPALLSFPSVSVIQFLQLGAMGKPLVLCRKYYTTSCGNQKWY